jgi:GNAT superfamily N-acetyltransferase
VSSRPFPGTTSAIPEPPAPPGALAALAADVRCLARSRGLQEALRKAGHAAAETLYTRDDMLILRRDLDDIPPGPPETRLRVEPLSGEHVAALSAFNRAACAARADRRLAEYRRRGYHGFIAHEGSVVAGYYWWVDGRTPRHPHLAPLGIALEDRDVYGFDFLLAEAHRGGGRSAEFLHHVESRLRDLGYARLWGYVRRSNTPARWLYAVRGYEVVRTLPLRASALR